MTLAIVATSPSSICLNSSSDERHTRTHIVPPDILDYPTSTDMVVREGSNVTLKCAARGSPQPNITWRRESGESIAIGGQREGNKNKENIAISSNRQHT